MAKKKKSGKQSTLVKEAKAVYRGYKDKLMELLAAFIEGQLEGLVDMAKNMVHLKEKLRHFVTAISLAVAGLVVFMLGVAGVLAEYFSMSEPGVQLGLGVVVVVAAVIMYKMG